MFAKQKKNACDIYSCASTKSLKSRIMETDPLFHTKYISK